MALEDKSQSELNYKVQNCILKKSQQQLIHYFSNAIISTSLKFPLS